MNKIVKITPAYKDYLWGGTKLKEYYNKKSDLDIIAESWEVSTHKDFAVGLESDGSDGITCPCACGKRRIQCAVGIEAGNASCCSTVIGGK